MGKSEEEKKLMKGRTGCGLSYLDLEPLPKRVFYPSLAAGYNLKPSKIADVILALETYLSSARDCANLDNPTLLKVPAYIKSDGRKLIISTGIEETLASFDLALLVISEKPRFRIYGHESVVIPSWDLHFIGKKYSK